MTGMDITIHASMLPHDDPVASVAFYRDILGFEVRHDVEYGGMHWITVGPPGQPETSIVLYPPAATPGKGGFTVRQSKDSGAAGNPLRSKIIFATLPRNLPSASARHTGRRVLASAG